MTVSDRLVWRGRVIIYGGWIRASTEKLWLHCFLKEASPTAEYLRSASLDIRKIKNYVQSRASCDVDGFVGHKDGSVVRTCAGKDLDEDPMTVLEPGCFGIGGQPTV